MSTSSATTQPHVQPGLAWPGLSRRQRQLLAVLGWLALATALTLGVWLLQVWLSTDGSHPAVKMVSQRFRMVPDAAQAGTDWHEVQLPDTWAARGQASSGVGRYDIGFTLAQPPTELSAAPWAVRFDRLSYQHKVWLNGQLIHTDSQSQGLSGRPMAYMAQVPAQLLKAGANRLEVEVRHGSLGGLSAPLIGPVPDLIEGYSLHAFMTESLPRTINIIAASFAFFLTLIWLKRKQEVTIGILGLLCIVISVRNWTYYVVHSPTLPPFMSDWLYYTAQITATVLLGLFAMAVSERWNTRFAKVLGVALVALPVLGAVAASHGMLTQVRAVVYPALLVLMLPTLSLLLRVPSRYGGLSALGMVLGVALAMVAGIHDYLRLQGIVSVMHSFWLPLASPVSLACYGVVLINRFVQAMGEVEQHNAQLEAKVGERTRDLVAANAAKGHFLAAASHDLRQPVAAVGLLSGLLRERLRQTDLHDITERLSQAVRAMENLLSGLLDLSRLEAGAIKPHRQPVDLAHLLRRIASHEREAAAAKGIELRVHPTRAVAFSDPVLLEQMLRNLIGNAVRYTQRGGVLVGVRRRAGQLSVQVWDTGGGIAPQDQQRIFEDFVQLGNPERNQAKGLGLGLAIVQRASRLLHHPIGVQSRVGRGSCFSIGVPNHHRTDAQGVLIDSTASPAPHLSAHPTPHPEHPAESGAMPGTDTPAQPLGERHILVLDDDAAVRHALCARLKSWGAFASPLDSLEALDELLQRVMVVDLLISDHQLCDGDGLSAIRMARAHHAQLPALIITGDTATPRLQELMHSGVPVLHKPFQAEELLRVIDLLLSTRGGPEAGATQQRSA